MLISTAVSRPSFAAAIVFRLVLAVELALPMAAVQAQDYRIIDLGTLGGRSSGARNIGPRGSVVGWSYTAAGERHAFLYRNGTLTDLGTLPGGTDSIATGINRYGRVVGSSGVNEFGPQFEEVRQAFIWRDGAMQSLGALYCPCDYNRRYGISEAYAINDQDQVVGRSETVRGTSVTHAYLWQSGAMQDLDGPGNAAPSRAFDINAEALVVGDFAHDDYGHAGVWRHGIRRDLGTLPGYASSTALAVNTRGDVVGWAQTADGTASRAFLWRNGVMTDLGGLPAASDSRAVDINDNGWIVGRSGNGDKTRAVLWRGGVVIDLNDYLRGAQNWSLTGAAAIDEGGDITGTGVHNGRIRAFLLEPAGIPASGAGR